MIKTVEEGLAKYKKMLRNYLLYFARRDKQYGRTPGTTYFDYSSHDDNIIRATHERNNAAKVLGLTSREMARIERKIKAELQSGKIQRKLKNKQKKNCGS